MIDASIQTLSKFRIWLLAIRPKTLWAAFIPVLIGSAFAYDDRLFHLPSAALALLGALAIQIGTNLSNDYADFAKGADTELRVGPVRVTQSGLLSPTEVRTGAILAFVVAILAGLYLIFRGGWPVLAIGVASIVSGILYTSGPKPLGYMGLGDLFVLLFFGPVAVGGSYYVQALTITPEVILAGLGPGLLSVALLVVNNVRDIEEDRSTGKRTLAVRFGRSFAQWEYTLSVVTAAAIPPILALWSGKSLWPLACLVIVPLSIPAIRTLTRGTAGRALNRLLGTTARVSLIYSFIFSLSWIV